MGGQWETQLTMAKEIMKTNEQPKPGVPVITDPVLDAVVAQLKGVKFSKEILNEDEPGEVPKVHNKPNTFAFLDAYAYQGPTLSLTE